MTDRLAKIICQPGLINPYVKNYRGLQKRGFLTCIKMDAYTDQHNPERIMTITSDFQIQKVVIVQDAVVYPFACGAFCIEFLVHLLSLVSGFRDYKIRRRYKKRV